MSDLPPPDLNLDLPERQRNVESDERIATNTANELIIWYNVARPGDWMDSTVTRFAIILKYGEDMEYTQAENFFWECAAEGTMKPVVRVVDRYLLPKGKHIQFDILVNPQKIEDSIIYYKLVDVSAISDYNDLDIIDI